MTQPVTRFNIEEDKVYVCRVPHKVMSEYLGEDVYQHILAFLRPVNDGGMFEFVDPVGNHVVGCVGSHKVEEFVFDWEVFLDELDYDRSKS